MVEAGLEVLLARTSLSFCARTALSLNKKSYELEYAFVVGASGLNKETE